MTELGNLIEAASHANKGRSMQAAADLATLRGFPISKSHISKSAKGILSITPQVVRGIAAGYDVTEEDVVRAALVDLDLAIMDYNPGPESAIRRDPNLSMEARSMLLAALQAARTALQSGRPRRVVTPVTENQGQEFSGPLAAFVEPRTRDDGTGEVTGEDRRENRK